MNLYLDASALVKRYLSEPGTPETRRVIDAADVQGTTVVSRAEVAFRARENGSHGGG
jgi:predicted nucleic acid-binding protein